MRRASLVDRAFIGRETPEMPIEVEKGRIRQFAAAIAESNPIYFDDAAARAAGYPAILAPPIVSTADPRTMQERFSAEIGRAHV